MVRVGSASIASQMSWGRWMVYSRRSTQKAPASRTTETSGRKRRTRAPRSEDGVVPVGLATAGVVTGYKVQLERQGGGKAVNATLRAIPERRKFRRWEG
jgi:hypothetical protein